MGDIASEFAQRIVISGTAFKAMVEAVRDRLLDWSIELEKRGISGEDLSFDDSEKQAAHTQTFHIQNATGIFGNVSRSTVNIYDYSSLHQTLKQHEVPQAARNELENIMDDLKSAHPAKKAPVVERAKQWVVKNKEFLGASISIVKQALGLTD